MIAKINGMQRKLNKIKKLTFLLIGSLIGNIFFIFLLLLNHLVIINNV